METSQPALLPYRHTPEETRKQGSLNPACGTEKAVLAALRNNNKLLNELAARYEVSWQKARPVDRPAINCPEDVYRLIGPEMANLAQEQLRILLLDTRNQVIEQAIIYQGNVNTSVIRPAEVFRPAVLENAASIIVCHNHPSGNPEPSAQDIAITKTLKEAGELLEIQLLDHIIVGSENRLVSLKERQAI